MIATWLTEQLGVSVPVVSAPMAGTSGGRLAAAVSAAGALGMIGIGVSSADEVRAHTQVAAATGRPFGIGFLAWLLDRQPGVVDVALESRPALLSLSYGDISRHVEVAHQAGVPVATQAGTVDDARRAVDAGVDVVVARGGEGGGHGRNLVATLPLLQAVLDAVDVPVLAAGGIATGRGVAAVLAAGAAGAWVGTAFLACDEADTSEPARRAVLGADVTDTVYTTVYDAGRRVPWPREFGGRAVRTAFSDTWDGRDDEVISSGVRMEDDPVWAGQAAGFVRAPGPAAAVVAELASAEHHLTEIARRCR